MDERRYLDLAEAALKRVIAAFDDVDLDVADVDSAGDVVTITLRTPRGGGKKVVLNTQRPTRQLWLAGSGRAWHFSYDETGARWLDDKGQGDELYGTLGRLCSEAGVPAQFS
jgi:CyaY protein